MFLTKDELSELTDLKMPSAQCKWLADHGYPYDKSASGKPKVLRSYIESRLGQQVQATQNLNEPDFAALNR